MVKTIFEKIYHGYEEYYDLERDIQEMFCYGEAQKIPGEFTGKLYVMVGYEGDDLNETQI